jgi:hypothetical protein
MMLHGMRSWATINANVELELVLRPTASRPLRLGIGLPCGTHDHVLSSFPFDNYFVVLPRTPSLTRGRVCNLQCNRWLVRSLRTNNHALPSHLRLCSLFVASYDSQGLRWRYSNPPPHGFCQYDCERWCQLAGHSTREASLPCVAVPSCSFVCTQFHVSYITNTKSCVIIEYKVNYYSSVREEVWPPLWSSGQSSWLQIRRPGFDSRH